MPEGGTWVSVLLCGIPQNVHPLLHDTARCVVCTQVEMDCNIPSGESFCRQFLLGQRFFQQEFGTP